MFSVHDLLLHVYDTSGASSELALHVVREEGEGGEGDWGKAEGEGGRGGGLGERWKVRGEVEG